MGRKWGDAIRWGGANEATHKVMQTKSSSIVLYGTLVHRDAGLKHWCRCNRPLRLKVDQLRANC
jgi:hypothetical protein